MWPALLARLHKVLGEYGNNNTGEYSYISLLTSLWANNECSVAMKPCSVHTKQSTNNFSVHNKQSTNNFMLSEYTHSNTLNQLIFSRKSVQ